MRTALTIHPPTSINLRNMLLSLFLLCSAIALNAAPPYGPPPAPSTDEAVIITGWLHVEDLSMSDVVVEVEVNGEVNRGQVSENGKFTISLPANAEVVLRFEKPGHLTKEVVVDTHHAQDGSFGKQTRHVKCAVIMELERWMGGLTYPGPVGSLGFDADGGCLAVSHERKLVQAKRRVVMQF